MYDFLNTTPKNEKRVQTTLNKSNNCTCQCTCNQRRKRRRENIQNQTITDNVTSTPSEKLLDPSNNSPEQTITKVTEVSVMTMNVPSETPLHTQNVEPQDSDNLLRQLEILFQDDNNEDDIFEQSLWNDTNPANEEIPNDNKKDNCEPVNIIESNNISTANVTQSLDEKLASLAGHFVENSDNNTKPTNKKTNPTSNKWLCEEYFMKLQLYEILDQLRDCNRAKLARVRIIYFLI